MKKFKAVKETEPVIPVEELSVNQLRKIDQQKKKAQEEERQRIENELIAKQMAFEAEKERKRRIEAEKIAQQKKYEEEQKKKLENMFKDLTKVQKAAPVQKDIKNFEDVMAEDEQMTVK